MYLICLLVSVPMLIFCPADKSVALLQVKTLVPEEPVHVVAPLLGVPVVPVW